MVRLPRLLPLLALASALPLVHCSSDETSNPTPTPVAPFPPTAFDDIAIQETLNGAGLSGPVDVLRDDAGIPHIYALTLADAAYAQGYVMAQDRWIQMDFARRQAKGTLCEVVGGASADAVQSDLRYRAHHFKATSEAYWQKLQASPDTVDKALAAGLTSFAAGVNAWQADLKAGKYSLQAELALLYSVDSVTAWSEVDSLVLGELQAFNLSFDAESEIQYSRAKEASHTVFETSADPAKLARAKFFEDITSPKPVLPVFTVNGWGEVATIASGTSMEGTTTASALATGAKVTREARVAAPSRAEALARKKLYDGALRGLRGVGLDRRGQPERGSNNWVVGPSLSATGHAMVANDTHLSLSNPPIFYLSHVVTKGGLDLMGVQFPGIPLAILGMNRHVAWGSTVSYIDVTDVYEETVAPCAAGTCVKFKGADVPLVPRDETFAVGLKGQTSSTITARYYDVPHHGPIVPRPKADGVETLGTKELSIRYTGYEQGTLLRAVYGLAVSTTVEQASNALATYFTHGGQNWVLADDKGTIAWTQAVRIPRRPKGTKAWGVLPGDGSAEWDGYFAPGDAPQSKNPAKGYLATANADPLGTTQDGDPGNEPEVGGFPRYLGATYDPGTRVARITKRIQDDTAGGKKLDLAGMSSIQADAVSEWARALSPTLVDALTALVEQNATPTAHPELATMLAAAKPETRAALATARDVMKAWTSFDTPSATDGEAPTEAQIADSKATVIFHAWLGRFVTGTVGDELEALEAPFDQGGALKMMVRLIQDPSQVATASVIFDDLKTVEVETKALVAAKAALNGLEWVVTKPTLGTDAAKWRWGSIHQLAPAFFAPIGLDLPAIPRHGSIGTVDVAGYYAGGDDYGFGAGPAIRFVCEVDPEKGPIARNTLPGGQIFDPTSPHYKDLYALWAKNQTIDLAYRAEDVATRAKREAEVNGLGRRRFAPPAP